MVLYASTLGQREGRRIDRNTTYLTMQQVAHRKDPTQVHPMSQLALVVGDGICGDAESKDGKYFL